MCGAASGPQSRHKPHREKEIFHHSSRVLDEYNRNKIKLSKFAGKAGKLSQREVMWVLATRYGQMISSWRIVVLRMMILCYNSRLQLLLAHHHEERFRNRW